VKQAADSALQKIGASPRAVLALLTAIYGLNYIDRQILGLLAQPIKHDLGLSDTSLGLLTGLAFALFYTSLGLAIARLAERGWRKTIIVSSVLIFSISTGAGGFAVNFWQLFATRVLVGVGEGGTTPASLAILSDLYSPERRAGAMAVFSVGAQIGILVGFVLGGFVAARFGWRAAFMVAGAPGLVLALLAVKVVRFPLRSPPPISRTLPTTIFSLLRRRSFALLCLAGGTILFCGNAVNSWMPAYLQREFGIGSQTIGLLYGLGLGVMGAGVTWITGKLADRLYVKSSTAPLLMAAIVTLLAMACILGVLWMPRIGAAIVLLLPGLSCMVVWQGPVLALIQGLAAEHERPTATATFLFIANIIGLGLGPLTVGLISDNIGRETAAGLRLGMSCALAVAPVSTLLLWAAMRSLRKDLGHTETVSRAAAA
jgi:predicted MFS family arabinose efflux permease